VTITTVTTTTNDALRRAVASALVALGLSAQISAQELPGSAQLPGAETTPQPTATPDKKPTQDWTFEPVIALAAIYTDNVDLAPPGHEESELAMQLAPEISVKRSSERLDLDVRYRFEQLAYQEQSDRNESFQQAEANIVAELVRSHFFVEANGSLDQQVVDPDQTFPPSNIPLSANRIDAVNLEVAPYYRQPLGGLGDLELRYDRAQVDYGDPPEHNPTQQIQDVDRQQAFVTLVSPARRQGTTWGLNYHYDRQEFTDFSEVEFEEASLDIGYKVTSNIRVFGTGGAESDWREHRSTADLDDPFWEAGFSYIRPERDDFTLTFGHRTFGDTVGLNWVHTFQGVRAILHYFEDPSTNAGARFETDDSLQIPGNALDRPNDSSVFLRQRLEGGVEWDRGRSLWVLTLYAEERSDRVNDPDAIQDFGDERIKGTNGTWNWKAGSRTDLGFGLGWERSELSDGRDFDIMHGSVEAHYALGLHTGLRLKLEHNTRGGDPQVHVAEGDVANFDENRVSLFIERNFF